MAHLSELHQTQRPHDSKSPSSKVLLGALASNGYAQYQFHPSTSLFQYSAFSCVQGVCRWGRYFRVFMHTLIGPDDSQTQWLPVPVVAIALGTNSLVGCYLGDRHRGSNNIALLVRIWKKMDQGVQPACSVWAFKCWTCIPGFSSGFSVEQRRVLATRAHDHSTRGGV
jgi:hypothetical protein